MWFRSMSAGADGGPVVGRGARSLGIRVPEDVHPDPTGQVHPGGGGMSVSPDSMWHLPNHRRPRGMGRGSTGPADRVYSIGLPALTQRELAVRADPRTPALHALVEPAAPTPLEAFEARLAATRPDWRQAWPP